MGKHTPIPNSRRLLVRSDASSAGEDHLLLEPVAAPTEGQNDIAPLRQPELEPEPAEGESPAAPLPLPPPPSEAPVTQPMAAVRAEPPEADRTGLIDRWRRAATREGWLPLEYWSTSLGGGKPSRSKTGTNVWFEVSGQQWGVAVCPGTQRALWGGETLCLTFAPLLWRGQPMLHVLDAEKILAPLVWPVKPAALDGAVVVLDPGHGGANRGARNVATGRFEKDYTLDWALRAKPLLEQLGWQVVLTRTNDMDLSLPDRVAVADRVRADLFISLHFNSSATQSSLQGVESYWTSPVGLPTLLNRGFADNTVQAWPNNAFDAHNLRLALRVHQGVRSRIRGDDRGVRHARLLGVLRSQSRPAALVEGGYLCNPHEARRIADPNHRQLLAEGLADALREGPESFRW